MTELDDAFVPLAKELLDDYGHSVTVTITTPGAYNPATGERINTESTDTFNGYLKVADEGLVDGETYLAGDAILLIAGSDHTPVVGDKYMIDGKEWEAINPIPVRSGSQIALYKVHVRN